MDISRFVGKYLKAADLQGRRVPVIIESVQEEEMKDRKGQTENKAVVYFRGKEKGLVLNTTNITVMVDMFGTETDHWVGHQIVLVSERVSAFGEIVDAIRVHMPEQQVAPDSSPPAQSPPPQPAHQGPPPTAYEQSKTGPIEAPGTPQRPPARGYADDEVPF